MSARKPAARAGLHLPEFVPPCLATLSDKPPTGPDWVHEIKLDGYRLQARLTEGAVRLRTRSGLDWTERFGPLSASIQGLGASSALLDGEAIVEDENGVPDFPALVAALKGQSRARIVYVAFDLLHLDGIDMTTRPLLVRKAALEKVLSQRRSKPPAGTLRFSAHMTGDGGRMLSEACRLGLEGIVSKRSDRPYRSGRGADWLKSKCVNGAEFVVAGYVPSTAMRDAIGALVLGYYRDGALIYAGRVGTGFSHATAHELWQRLQPMRVANSPFLMPMTAAERRGVVWSKPTLVANVTFRAWTGDDRLRHAAYVSLREDKPAGDVGDPRVS